MNTVKGQFLYHKPSKRYCVVLQGRKDWGNEAETVVNFNNKKVTPVEVYNKDLTKNFRIGGK